jgi:hypothetical protein
MRRITDPNLLRWHTPRFDLDGAEVAATMAGRSFATSFIQDLIASGIDDHSAHAIRLAAEGRFDADINAWLTKIRDDAWQLNATPAQIEAVLRAFLQAAQARFNGGPQ